MMPDRYPPQEPLSAVGAAYAARILALAPTAAGSELAYGADPYQSLAVWRPPQPNGDVLVFFHGGGWTSGYKEWMAFMAPAFLAHDVTFVSAGYRLAPGHVFPTGFDDCADAVAAVHRNVLPRGGRLFVGGHSAGGHYAALLAVTSRWRAARGLPARPLAGCLPVSGTYRFGPGSGLSMRPRFLGPVDAMPGADPGAPSPVERAASPIDAIEADACPPFLIAHGGRDFPHLIRQAEDMSAALAAAGVDATRLVLPDRDHFDASVAAGEPDGPWVAPAVAWMNARDAGAAKA